MKKLKLSGETRFWLKIAAIVLIPILSLFACMNKNYFDKNSLASQRKRYLQGKNNAQYREEVKILNEIVALMERDDFQKLLDEKLVQYGSVRVYPTDFVKNKYGKLWLDDQPIKDVLYPHLKTYKERGIAFYESGHDASSVDFMIDGKKEKDGYGDPLCKIQYIPKTDSFNAYACWDSHDCDDYIETDDSKNSKNSNNSNNENNPNNCNDCNN